MLALNNQVTTDGYTQHTTREQPGTVRLNLHVYNAAIYWSWMDLTGVWGEDIFAPPGERSYDRKIRGVRVRSAVAGKPARVTVELLGKWDVAA